MAGDKCQLEPQNANALPVVNLVKVAGAYFSHCYDLISPLVMPALCSAHLVYSALFFALHHDTATNGNHTHTHYNQDLIFTHFLALVPCIKYTSPHC